MRVTRLYADNQGESHFEEIEVEFSPTEFAPPAPPLHVSSPVPTHQVIFLSAHAEWSGDWHPSPARQYMVVLSGQLEIEASDGERRQFKGGDVALGNDTSGMGHRSSVVGSKPFLAVIIQLPE